MTFRVVNFETLSKHYMKYQEGITKIADTKRQFVEKLSPFRKELEEIITKMNSGEKLELETEARFHELQGYAMEIDEDYKSTMRTMNDELSKDIFTDLSEIITEWSEKNDIDIVVSSTEVVYMKPKNDSTNEILEILKQKGVFI